MNMVLKHQRIYKGKIMIWNIFDELYPNGLESGRILDEAIKEVYGEEYDEND